MGTRITFYGGAGQVGGNQILLEDKMMGNIMLDFGMNFAEEGEYFEEFLKPSKKRGLHDYLCFGFIPPLEGIYRRDFELDDLWEKFKNRPLYRNLELDAVFISHAHTDHFGYLSFVDVTVPVYCSPVTALIMKAMQDTSQNIFDICYFKEYKKEYSKIEKDGLEFTKEVIRAVSKSDSKNNSKYDHNYQLRGFVLLEEPRYGCEKFTEFMIESPTKSNEINKNRHKIKETRLKDYKYWPVDHSVPGATAYAFETEGGWVVYTGDIRMHGKKGGKTKTFIQEAARLKPKVLMCECTHVDREKSVTEEDVKNNALDVVKNAKGKLVIADFAPRNIERLETFFDIARYTGRKLVVTDKDFYLLSALYHNVGEINWDPLSDEHINIYYDISLREDKWKNKLLEGINDKLVIGDELRRNPGDYILCFSYYDFDDLLSIEPYNAVYIYSSSEAYNEEMAIDHKKMLNWIRFFDMELYGKLGDINKDDGRFHCSGHIDGQGMIELIETIRPEIIIPVHGENRQFFEKFRGMAEVVWPSEKGFKIEL